VAGAIVLLGLSAVRSAAAADAPVSPEAKRHVELGVGHYDAGRYAEAVTEFELAYRLSNKPALLFNIARAESKLGHEEAAIAFLRRYLEERPDAPDSAAVLAEVEARERAQAMTKDKQHAEAEAAEARKQADALTAQAARAAKAEAERQAATSRPVAARASAIADGGRDGKLTAARRAGIALVVIGPVLAGVGIALGVVALQSADQVTRGAGEFATCCASAESRGRASGGAGIALDVVGGLAAVAGAGVLIWSYTGRGVERRAWLQPSGRGLALAGAF